MKKNLLIALSALMLLSVAFASGCSQNSQRAGEDYYADDLYKMIPKDKHEKRFPDRHKDDDNKHCYYEEGTAAYFCQYWDDWDD